MTNVVISNRNIMNQRIKSIEQSKVLLPFNVRKEQASKLSLLLSKIMVKFSYEPDKLIISDLFYNGLTIRESKKNLSNCRFTLSKTYVVTMKQSFISKVKKFYDRIVETVIPPRPIFNIGNETNLQQALKEATVEIDLNAINAGLNNIANGQNLNNAVQEQPAQVLANNPLGETVIENPINLNVASEIVVESTPVVTPTVSEVNQNSQEQLHSKVQETVNVPIQPVQPITVEPTAVPNQEIVQYPQQEVEKTKKKVKKLKGNILAIPVIAIWLGAVFFGTLKLVTNILTQ